jgi:hypothetical protein
LASQSYKTEWTQELKNASFHEFTVNLYHFYFNIHYQFDYVNCKYLSISFCQQRWYKFHQNIRTEDARKLFDYRANRMLTRNFYGARLNTIRETGSDDPRDWTNFEPYWILRLAWKLLIHEWCDEYFRALSD